MSKLLGGLQGVPDKTGATQRLLRKLETELAKALDRIAALERRVTALEP